MSSVAWSASVLVVFVVGFCHGQYNDLPGCTVDKLEACGTDYVIYANTKRIEEGGEGLEKQCGIFLEQLNCSIAFCRRCLSGFPRAIALLGLKSAAEFYEESCNTSTALHGEYRKNAVCLNKAGDRLNERMKDILLKLYTVKEKIPQQEKIYHACCLYYDFLDDTGASVKGVCPNPEVHKFFAGFMDRIFGEMLGLACGPYKQGSRQCRQQERVKPDASIRAKARNFVEPMIDVVQSLGSRRG